MTIEFREFIARIDLHLEREKLFVFGDNMVRRGYGGQAREMRGEPNAVGLPTKHRPTMRDGSFFTDKDLAAVLEAIKPDVYRLEEHLRNGGTVVWPKYGIGTGLAGLRQRAPLIQQYYDTLVLTLSQL